MIKVVELRKKYKNFELNVNNLEFLPGECTVLLGNNGCGKTTCLRLLLDLIKADSSEVLFGVNHNFGIDNWKKHIGAYIDEMFLIGFLTSMEYFILIGDILGIENSEVSSFINEFKKFLPPSKDLNGKRIRQLSSGNKAKIGIIGSLLGGPLVLIYDEPWSNLDPTSSFNLCCLLADRKAVGDTIVLASHNLQHVFGLADRFLLFENGRVIQDLRSNMESREQIEQYFRTGAES